jgi:single-strand DNA-binding protein
MLNHIVIMGRLTRDPELRRTNSGIAVAKFTVAVERDFPSKETGEKETDFIYCVGWRQIGEFVSKYFKKGSMIVVSGRLQIKNWTDDNGVRHNTAEIVADNVYFGESKRDKENQSSTPNPYTTATYNTPSYGGYSTPFNGVKPAVTDWDMLDDDDAQLPF